MPSKIAITSVGLLGFGAFGQLIAAHLHPHFPLVVYDRSMLPGDRLEGRVRAGDMAAIGRCDVVILAVPVGELASVIKDLRPYLHPSSVVVDVASVKVNAVRAMEAELPPFVDIVGTHPLFGPQSAREGIRGRKIAVCPVRGRSAPRIAAFLRSMLGLKVFLTTPEEHDREVAVVQGVTHLIAKVLVRMEPLPRRLTTASFDHLMQATEMVRYDAASVFRAIECDNPFAAEIRERFFNLAQEARAELDER
ncbi:MAG: prephenate dehydrogenase/arogenate dehydrogenase family protein [Xanthobacteraceae bacterium]